MLAAARCSEIRDNGDGTFEILGLPAIMCLSFSAELALKSLLSHYGKRTHGHHLGKLFRSLPVIAQDFIVSNCALSRATFDMRLQSVALVFVDWRYEYETQGPKGVDAGFLESLANGAASFYENMIAQEPPRAA